MIRRTLSLRARLAGMLALLFLGGMVGLYLAAQSYAHTAADRSFDRLLAGSALSISETLSIDGTDVLVDVPYAALDMLSAAPDDRVFYRVFGPGTQTVTGYGDLPVRGVPAQSRAGLDNDEPRFFDAVYRGERVRFVLLGRQVAEPGVDGWIWVQVGQTRRARAALAAELVLGALAPIALITVLALALVWFGIDRALRPLHRLGDELAARTPEQLQPIAHAVPDEMIPLVVAMNGFMRRLDANAETLRAFIAEAAHQMRTPLAALRAQAHVAATDDPEDLRRSLDAIERNASKLSRLLNQLLSDATVTHRSDLRRFERFDLVALVRQAIRETVPISEDVDVRFDCDLASAWCIGDGLLLGEAMKNVIDNALRHGGAAGGRLDVALEAVDAGYDVTVSDRGPGLPPGDREHLFERFARGGTGAPGAGLGLAIVRRALQSNGGDVMLEDREGGGLRVRLAWRGQPVQEDT